jgi:hypothetical protein
MHPARRALIGPLVLLATSIDPGGLAAPAVALADTVPRGARAERPRATGVVVTSAELDVGGVKARLSPGVPVAVSAGGGARPRVTVVGPIELVGRLDARVLGARVAREVELHDAGGAVVGRALPGALVTIARRPAVGIATIGLVSPFGGRFQVDASALTSDPRDLVLPTYEAELLSAATEVPVAAAPRGRPIVILGPGARVEPLAPPSGGWSRVRTYGGVAIEGVAPADRLRPADAPPPDPPRRMAPSHEALVDCPVYADAAGKRPAGTLRGGALVTLGIEVSGPLGRVMTHGDVVAELWAPIASLRLLEASVWAEGQ